MTSNEPHDTSSPSACANCGTPLTDAWCPHCGQHRRGSARLALREIAARFCEHLLDVDSAFLRTFVGLIVRPGVVCRDYVEGRRKRYMNPFGYFVLAGTVSIVVSSVASWAFGAAQPAAEDDELAANWASWILLALLIPIAVIWWRLFRPAGLNLAENYAFALYVMGQFLWFEVVILLPLSYVLSETALWSVYGVTWLAYVVFAGVPFYREPPFRVLSKVLLSGVILAAVLMLVGIAMFFIWPTEVAG